MFGFYVASNRYSQKVQKVQKLIQETSYNVLSLGEITKAIFRLQRFSRVWANNPEAGHPYMAPTDVFYFKPLRERENTEKAYVTKNKHSSRSSLKLAEGSDIEELSLEGEKKFFVKSGWILVTCSGTVGRVMLVQESLEKYFLSHDIIRIVPKEDTFEGYLYAYLDSYLGQTLLKRDEYGGWTQHIEPSHVNSLPVILPPKEKQKRIHNKVLEAFKAREEFLQKEEDAEGFLSKIIS